MSVLEHLIPGDWETARRNFERIASVLGLISRSEDGFGFTVAGVGVRFGTGSATWTAAVLSGAVTVPHGLGRAPGYVGVQTQSQVFDFKATADATNLTITGYRTDNTAQSGTINFYWVAIG